MKFGQPILTSELSGAMGGVVASSSRGGVGYFRVRRRPGNPKSPGQTAVRFIMTAVAAAWRSTLTSGERAAWAAIAGESSSGIDAYVGGNSVAMLAGVARVDTAPASGSLSVPPITVDPVLDESANTLSVTVPVLWDGEARAAVFLTAPQSASRASRQFNFLFAGSTADAATGAQAVSIPTTHPAFNAAVGDVVYVRVVPFAQADYPQAGAKGQGQEYRVIVTA
jgi:hypothetical protein